MPERVVQIRVDVTGLQDASAGFKGAADDVKGLGTAAADAGATAAPAFSAMDAASQKLQASLDKLGASEGPRGMIKNAALAQVALQDFTAEATKAGMAQDVLAQKSAAASAQIAAAADKVGVFRKAQMDLTSQGALAGSQLDKLRTSGTSLSGLFQSMEQTGSGLTKSLGQMGMSLGIAGIAFAGAKLAGEALGKAVDYVAQKNQLLTDTHAKAKNAAELHAAAMLALNKGLIANSDTTAGLIKNYELYNLSHARAVTAIKEHADKVLGLNAALLTEKTIVEQSEESAARLAGIEEDATKATANITTAEEHLATVRATMPEKIGRVMDAEIALMLAKDTAKTKQAEYNLAIEKAGPAILAEVAAYRALGDAMPPALRAEAAALDELKKKHDDATEAMKKAIETAKNLPAAMQNAIEGEKKLGEAAKLVADSHDKIIPAITKVIEDVGRGKLSFDAGALSLAEYAREHKLTAVEVVQMAVEQGRLAAKMNEADAKMAEEIAGLQALGGGLRSAADDTRTLAEQTDALGKIGDAVNKQIDDRNKAIDAGTTATADYAVEQVRLNKAIADGSMTDDDIARRQKNIDMMKSEAEAAKNAADAFGNLASSFGQVSMQADKAASGLQGVAWEMRSATPVTVTLNDSQNALVESLAKVADQYGKTSLWVEHLLSQFEKGTVSLADFRKQLHDMLLGMMAMPDAFGNTSIQMNIMLTLLDKFKNTASNGWPVATTTAPYATAP